MRPIPARTNNRQDAIVGMDLSKVADVWLGILRDFGALNFAIELFSLTFREGYALVARTI